MAVVLKPGQLEKISRLRNGDMIDGKYQLKEVLGVGGMSVVWRAVDVNLQKDWAIKETRKDKGHKKVQDNEIEVLKKLDHPGLPRIVGKSKVGDSDVIIMDLVEGKSLGDILKEEGAQDEKKVIEWALQICDALYYLHSQNPPIIYKDMKPDNVMVRGENRDTIKIIDLGISVDKDTKLQKAGTPAYQPNEQREGYADERSDIYALGITMHYLVTGVKPKLGNYAPIRNWNPLLSEGLERIINKCVETDPSRRYQSMKGLINDLKHPEFITRGYRKKQKQKMGAFLAACCASAVLVVGGFGLNVYADYQQNSDYDLLVEGKGDSNEQKLEDYVRAMELIPGRPEAYIQYLTICQTDRNGGYFNKERKDTFEAHYRSAREELNKNFSEETGKLNHLAGTSYLFFVNLDDTSSEKEPDLMAALRDGNVAQARDYFEMNYENQDQLHMDEQGISPAYFTICDFIVKYLDNPGDSQASSEQYANLVRDMSDAVNATKSRPESALQGLMLSNTVLQILNNQMTNLSRTGIDETQVWSLVESVEDTRDAVLKAFALSSEETSNEQQILRALNKNLEMVKDRIETVYSIARQNSDGSEGV